MFYPCTGNQNENNVNYDYNVPDYPGWEDLITSYDGYYVEFIPVPGDIGNFKALEYANLLEEKIEQSDADVNNIVCHSRGGQSCTHVLNDIDDDRISDIYYLDPSARITEPSENEEPYDSVHDIVRLFTGSYSFDVHLLTSNMAGANPAPDLIPVDKIFSDLGHNDLVHGLEVIEWILLDY